VKQLYQIPRTGQVRTDEVPVPQLGPGCVLVRVAASAVSAGTERGLVEFARKGLLQKARARPDLVRLVLEKARREGLLSAIDSANRKLEQPQSLGYSCAGTVLAVAPDVAEFQAGDRVACAGAGYANHAEFVAVPRHLVARIPGGESRVSFEASAFTTMGSIALHGFRLGEPQVGETVAVIGLGVIGLLAVQIARAASCYVVGMDPDPARCELAQRFGCAVATDPAEFDPVVAAAGGAMGADVVLITAASESSAPVELAAKVARSRARVVAVGAVGTTLPRQPYFEKELEFHISRSYGPGRYDANYEEKGQDYPIDYVRWTENRNMQAFLGLLAQGKVDVQPLITHRFDIAEAAQAYDLISGKMRTPYLGVVLRYSCDAAVQATVPLRSPVCAAQGRVGIGVLGAGSFASGVLMPALQATGQVSFQAVCTSRGLTARHAAQKFRAAYCTTDEEQVLADPAVQAVVIGTRHNLHARQVLAALRAGKHVFCEKPLCLNEQELGEICTAYRDSNAVLLVGFNRRFAPMVRQMREFFAGVHEPRVIQIRVNGGAIPISSWIQDPAQGGGRIIGEVCHFVDLVQHLAASRVHRVYARALPNQGKYADDNLAITLELSDGSVGQISYVANGDRSLGKERIEMFCGGATAVLHDYRRLKLVRHGRRKTVRSWLRQDKGHHEECEAFVTALRAGKPAPIAFEEIVATTLTTFRIQDSLSTGLPMAVDDAAVLGAQPQARTAAADQA
jgi:predicted dehydrogenase